MVTPSSRSLGVMSELGRNFELAAAPGLVPPEPLATIGGKISLAFEEWRAGDE